MRRRVRRPAVVPRLIGESCARWPFGFRHHLARDGSAACSTVGHAAGLVYHPSAACDPAVRPDCRGRLGIAFQITADRLQGQVEYAYRTDWTQVLTTILWGGRIDDVSRRVLTDALHMAADEAHPVRIHAFAAAARDLFRHTAQTLAARHKSRWLRRSTGCPVRDAPSDTVIVEVDPLHGDLLAAIDNLRKAACLRPRATIVKGAESDGSLQEALSALQELSDSLGDYLEQVLQPLTLPISRDAIRAFILETRREVDELAACRAADCVYAESLTISKPGGKAVSLEVEAWLGDYGGVRSEP